LKSKRTWIVIVILVTVAAVGAAVWMKNRGSNKNDYREIVVEKGSIELNVLATGTVKPENRLEVKPPIAGRAEQVLVQEGQNVAKGQPLLIMSSLERAALLDAARARGTEELKRWEDLYRAAPILAPIKGTIILRKIEPGQTFATTDAIIVMSDRLTLQAQVDETDIGQIHVGQTGVIVLDAYPNQPVDGKVEKIAYEANVVTNVTTYVVTLTVDKVPDFMRSGMTANVTFNVSTKSDIITIPSEAVRTRGNTKTVQMREAQSNKITDRKIETGVSDGRRVEVVSGLADGERILVPKLSTFLRDKGEGSNPFSPLGGNRSQQGQRPAKR
jgi:macrolide-specific efflux system membrane fusion protein